MMDEVDEPPRLSRLRQLPAELQDHIFRYAVVEHEPIKIRTHLVPNGQDLFDPGDQGDHDEVAVPPSSPSAAQASRSLRDQVLPIYFAGNTFVLDYSEESQATIVESLRPWIEIFVRYANKSARVGVQGTAPSYHDGCHHIPLSLLASLTSRGEITYAYQSTPPLPDDWSAPQLRVLGDIRRRGGTVAIQQLFYACHADLKPALEKLRQELNVEESDEDICCPFD